MGQSLFNGSLPPGDRQIRTVQKPPRPCRLLVKLIEEIDRRFKAQQQNLERDPPGRGR